MRYGLWTALTLLTLAAAPAPAATIKLVDWVGASRSAAIGLLQVCDGSVRVACDGSVMPAAGSVVAGDGSVKLIVPGAEPVVPGDGSVVPGDGSVIPGDGSVLVGLGGRVLPGDGSVMPGDGSVIVALAGLLDGAAVLSDGLLLQAFGDGSVRKLSLGRALRNPYLVIDTLDLAGFDFLAGDGAWRILGPGDPDNPFRALTVVQFLGVFNSLQWTAPQGVAYSFSFGIDADAFQVPLPATGWLAIGALLALGWSRRTARFARR